MQENNDTPQQSKLTDLQITINDDPKYWEWFDKWWEQDFSWAGLAKKNIYNSNQTLQDYWSGERDDLIEFAGRNWTRFHLPFHDQEGNPSPKHNFNQDEDALWQQEIKKKLNEATLQQAAQFTGVVFPERFMSTRKRTTDPNADICLRADWAQFGRKACFSDLSFSGNTNFSNAYFDVGASFEYVLFESRTKFAMAQFGDFISFKDVKFRDIADFGGARFRASSTFLNAEFKDNAIFKNTQFKESTRFENAVFRKHALFNYVVFGPFANFDKAKFFDTCSFAGPLSNEQRQTL